MKKLKNKILNWLFGTDNVKNYMELLGESIEHHKECIRLLDDHKETLDRSKEYIDDILKLIKICKKYGIDVDKEMKQIDHIKE
jgi:hypothetical protein